MPSGGTPRVPPGGGSGGGGAGGQQPPGRVRDGTGRPKAPCSVPDPPEGQAGTATPSQAISSPPA